MSTPWLAQRRAGREVVAGLAAATVAGLSVEAPAASAHVVVAAVVLLAMAGVLTACAAATRYPVAWQSERVLRAAAGGVAAAGAAASTAVAVGAGMTPLGALAVALGGCGAAIAAGAQQSPWSVVDVTDDAAPAEVQLLPPACRVVKRSIDVAVAATALVVVAPVLLVLAVVISLESPGGWLFKQTRVGENGRRFTLWKLRSMVAGNDDSRHKAYVASLIAGDGADHDGLYKMADDPRITRSGRWTRRLSLDELPQLFNVLRGDMSLAGPRPALPAEVERYDDRALLRLRCKPGITGLWQVSGRSRLTFDEMVELDVAYWQHWTLRRELSILARTARAVVAGDTA